MEEPIIPEQRLATSPVEERSPTRILLPLALGVVAALVGGWHYLCHLEVENTLTELSNELLREHLEGASALVEVGPFNNVIDIRVQLESKSTNGLAALIEDAVVEVFREELEPKIERALNTRTRRSMDVYTMLLPYKVSITVGEREVQSRGDDASRSASVRSARFEAVQQALSDCGYDIGRIDGILGPRTQKAIRAFRIQQGLEGSSISLDDLPSLVREKCATIKPPVHIEQLIQQSDVLNDRCRGGSGDVPETRVACEQRDEIVRSLEAQGWCHGHDPLPMSQRVWEPCRGGQAI